MPPTIDAGLVLYAAGAALLGLLVVALLWRRRRGSGLDISPVSEQWLAERKSRRTHE